METLLLALLLLAAVLVSAVLDQIIPKISLPLVQIAIGVVIALFMSGEINIKLDPELFLVLFIAPLLYDETKSADVATLWRLKKPILSLAIGLVLVTALIIGFAVNALIPSIPLAAAIALGAALGPTDAVAVSSLSKVVAIPDRQKRILQGELLLNDASGIVSFQFAIAAVSTGAFSLMHATGDFLLEFCGGLVLGALLGLLGKLLLGRAARIGVDNTTFHTLFDLSTPFIIYLFADHIGVSSVIAVVTAGLMSITSTNDAGPSVSKMNIVSSSVWKVLAFALNGVVFVLLGTQLPRAMQRTWDDVTISNVSLILYVALITIILLGIRFIWTAAMELLRWRKEGRTRNVKLPLRDALITTLSGAKGTITLSILFSIPFYVSTNPVMLFPQRNLIIFLACGVILCTLLISTFVVPLIAPKPKQPDTEVVEQETKLVVDMLGAVMAELTALQTAENRIAVQKATSSYRTRIAKLVSEHGLEEDSDPTLKIMALHWQREKVEEMLNQDETDPGTARRYLDRLAEAEVLLADASLVQALDSAWRRSRLLSKQVTQAIGHHIPALTDEQKQDAWRHVQIEAHKYALEHLTELLSDPHYPSGEVSDLVMQYQHTCNVFSATPPSLTAIARADNDAATFLLMGYQMELERIQELYEDELITRDTAKRLRNNVALMRMDSEGVI
ncbi:sodium:proton antiporter [Adlercreutzia sp. ZJ138]|uniref:cation:proton antiporter n=1 Tax=Adlercreutzia sp. ZJ138 TaxID=2709405 RepID=UPI0013EA6800|nr:sodium:proton antiporter [Adlercreutzia sp. ZJ138]